MPKPPSQRPIAPSRMWLWLFGLAAIAALLAVTWWRSPRVPRPDAAELVALKDIANGHLENGDYAQADELCSDLIRKLPENPLGYRNQTIARLAAVGQQGNAVGGNTKTETTITPELLVDSLTSLAKQEPEAAATYVLIARGGLLLDERGLTRPADLPAPLSALQKATQLEPDNMAYWYELSDLAQTAMYARDEEAQQVARRAIAKAYELAPRNLAVLRRQIVMLAQNKEEKLGQVLRAAEETFRPLQARVEQQAKGNLETYRQKALAAVEAGDWPAAMSACRVLDNLLAPQEAQKSDLRRASLFSLEFMRQDFEPEFYAQHIIHPLELPESQLRLRVRDWNLPELAPARDCELVDADLDGRLDLVVLEDARLIVLRQAGDVASLTWELLAEVTLPQGMENILVGDLDRDAPKLPAGTTQAVTPGLRQSIDCELAYPDFVLYGAGGMTIVRQQAGSEPGQRSLVVVEQSAGLQEAKGVITALLADWDHDGDLDLVAREAERIALWRHLGNLQFDDASDFSDLPPSGGQITALAAADVDHDLDLDIVCNGAGKDGSGWLLENLRHGQFRTRTLDDAFAPLAKSRDIALADVDGNGSWDVVTPAGTLLTQSALPGVWSVREFVEAGGTATQRLLLGDFDNDTWTDLLRWNPPAENAAGDYLLRGGRAARFTPWKVRIDRFPGRPQTFRAGDLDNDGDLDLLAATSDGQLVLLTNDGGNANAWLQVRIAGRADEKDRVNASGIGSTVEVKLPGRYQAQIVTRQPLHFGLGNAKQADACRILFTNGVPQVRIQPPANQQFCEKMELLSSCPFLYTWTGEKFEFCTDLLWAAPLGLQVTAGNVMPDRPWEYLKIDGERCLPKNAGYTLQITGELWEADYFDEVKLIAVDHPAEVQIFTNEKVGPPAIAEHKIHTVREPRKPVSAVNHRGRDLMPELAARDGNYAKPWDRAIRQGLVEDHFIELDLGQLDRPKRISLFLTGWIYPTDVGLNAALDQHPELAFPNPPAISVPDGDGAWKVVRPFMGFPSGKTKTIAVDISDIFGESQDYRLRITMSQELYWDEIFFTLDEVPVEIRETPLELSSADLHYRGFSGDIEPEPNAPRIYDYSVVRTDAKWPPMRGKFTRYGDVKELLKTWDDQQVVLGAGDEMTLTFRMPKNDPPPGWKRDFVLYNVGWDKDAVLHTLYGQDSDPLPFKAMTRYPYGPEESFPDTPQLRSYLQRYQTREQRPELFWRGLRRE